MFAVWCTGWLKIKHPTRQYAISPQPVAWFLKFLKLLNPDTSLNLMVYSVSTHCTLIINHTTMWNNYYENCNFYSGWFFGNFIGNFIGKDEWPPNLSNLNPLDCHVWGAMLECYKTFQPKPRWRKSCKQYGMICHRTPSTRPYWALSKGFELVWKPGADTLNTSWNKLFLRRFERVLKQSVTVWNVKFPCFRLISIQTLWWKL